MKLKLSNISNIIFFICLTLFLSFSAQLYSVKADDLVTVSYEATYHQSEAREMLSLINEFRTGDTWYWNEDNTTKTTIKAGELAPLQLDPELERVAMKRAAEIALFYCPGHRRPNGDPFYTAYTVGEAKGENIAYGQRNKNEMFMDWREDAELYVGQGHRRNMLQKMFSHIGIACAEVDGWKYWVQAFADKGTGQSMGTANDAKIVVHTEIRRDFIKGTGLKLYTGSDDDDYLYYSDDYENSPVDLKLGNSFKIIKMVPEIFSVINSMGVESVGIEIKSTNKTPDIIEFSPDGTITAKAEGKGQIVYEVFYPIVTRKKQLNINVSKTNISNDDIIIYVDGDTYTGNNEFQYTGKPVEPDIRVEYKEKVLKRDKDYNLDFKNNVNANVSEKMDANSPMAVITGINNYTGKTNVYFHILPKYITEKTTISEVPDQIYTGKKICPKPKITTKDGKVLSEGKDYSLSYSDNVEVGVATVDIEYKGNYEGGAYVYFSIIEKEAQSDKTENNKTIKYDKKENPEKEKKNIENKNSEKKITKPDYDEAAEQKQKKELPIRYNIQPIKR